MGSGHSTSIFYVSGADDNNDNNDSNDTLIELILIFGILIATLFLCLILVIFGWCYFQHQKLKQTILNTNKMVNNNDEVMIRIQKAKSNDAKNFNSSNNSNNYNTTNADIGNLEIEIVNNVINNNNKMMINEVDNKLENKAYSNQMEGVPGNELLSGTSKGLGDFNTNGVMINGDGVYENTTMHVTDNWQTWKELELVNWLKLELIKNGFSENHVIAFLNEFKKVHLTGQILESWLNDKSKDEILDQLKQRVKFNTKSFIWDATIQLIMQL